MNTTSEQKRTGENLADRTITGQTTGQTKSARPAKDTLNHWKRKLKKRTYIDRAGKETSVSTWQARVFYAGRETWFNTGTENRDAAAAKARDFYESLTKSGWETTMAKFKPVFEKRPSETLAEFATLCREVISKIEDPPRHTTSERYIKSLLQICHKLHVQKIAALTQAKVDQFKGEYLADARAAGRPEHSIKTSCNFILRNARVLFGQEYLAAYRKHGLDLQNPFDGVKLAKTTIQHYSPVSQAVLDSIWRDAKLLLVGDPTAPPPDRVKGRRWQPPDLRKPQPGAYILLLLELGLGLRRNEADKAEWSWIKSTADGRHVLQIQETPFFKTKSGHARTIPIEPTLYEAIQALRPNSPFQFIVPGRIPKLYQPGKHPINLPYRCDAHHRALADWLRHRGITDAKPCHAMRKEFGSYVATSFSLFHAQKLLGHSSPQVTSDYYAGLTQLPELKIARIAPETKEGAA